MRPARSRELKYRLSSIRYFGKSWRQRTGADSAAAAKGAAKSPEFPPDQVVVNWTLTTD
jgi:hypothetical protein